MKYNMLRVFLWLDSISASSLENLKPRGKTTLRPDLSAFMSIQFTCVRSWAEKTRFGQKVFM